MNRGAMNLICFLLNYAIKIPLVSNTAKVAHTGVLVCSSEKTSIET
jgi:hypothetical protein